MLLTLKLEKGRYSLLRRLRSRHLQIEILHIHSEVSLTITRYLFKVLSFTVTFRSTSLNELVTCAAFSNCSESATR